MNMIDWYKKVVFENYANFSGRARRSEYWYYTLCNIIASFILYVPIFTIGAVSENESALIIAWVISIILLLYTIATLIPSLAVTVRRLHDIGKSGWTLLVYFIPFVGPILLLVFLASDSESFTNKWGPNPKAIPDEINEIGTLNQI